MPICYIFNDKGEKLVRFNADSREYGSRIGIGRSQDNAICVSRFADVHVSRHHFVLYPSGRNWYIQDTNSTLGIRKDEKKIRSSVLEFGDIVRFSHLYFGFGEKSGPANYDVVWQFEGDPEEHRVALWPGRNMVGASSENSVVVSDGDGVSRFHAIIEVMNDKHLMIHKDHDTALVFVNGKPVGASAVVSAGDRITLGRTIVRIAHRPRMETEATINLCTKKALDGRRKSRGGYENSDQSERRMRILYGTLAAVILGGFAVLFGIIHMLF